LEPMMTAVIFRDNKECRFSLKGRKVKKIGTNLNSVPKPYRSADCKIKGTDIRYIKDLPGHFDTRTRSVPACKQKPVNIISLPDDPMNKKQTCP